MNKKKKKIFYSITDDLVMDFRTMGYFFLGVGLTMFMINISSMMTTLKYFPNFYILPSYYVSIASSVFLMLYSLYNIYVYENQK